MAISKVTLNGQTLMDVSKDTVDTDSTLIGYKGHKNDGTQFTGQYSGSARVYQDEEGYIVLSDEGNNNVDDEEQINDVNFIGKNGEILYSYTAEDFLQLQSLPSLPFYEGFLSQDWNWTLVDAKNNVNKMGACDIGVIVRPSDGKTHIYVDITDTVHPYIFRINQRIGNNAIVDWGDGSPTERKPTTNNCDFSHIYSEPGEYDISIEVIENISNFYAYYTYNDSGAWHKNAIKRVNTGVGLTGIASRSVNYCQNLTEFTISREVNTISTYVFEGCNKLKTIIVPDGITSVNTNCFRISGLKYFSLPNSITSIGVSCFEYCYYLKRAVVPQEVTSVGNYAFAKDTIMSELYFPDTITSLGTYTLQESRMLSSIPIPLKVSTIPTYYATSSMQVLSLNIPNNITKIDANAF